LPASDDDLTVGESATQDPALPPIEAVDWIFGALDVLEFVAWIVMH
jgi:hypothetical protein